jgi:hypothetical protein
MSMSTAPRDLAAIKHALELGLILATLIIATIMIVAAAHGDALTPDITIGRLHWPLRWLAVPGAVRCLVDDDVVGLWPR